jgi:superfamily II DNA or RNA helicase
MSVILRYDNRHVFIQGADLSTLRRLEAVTSYRVAGYMYSPGYKAGWWDGREHLLKNSAKLGWHAPVGLLQDIINELERLEIETKLRDERKLHGERRHIVFSDGGRPLRPYQQRAVKAVTVKAKGLPWFGRGIIKMPIRSGKTKTSAKLISMFGVRTLFIVPSQMLMYQTVKSFEEAFPEEHIGMVGDGVWNPRFVTVATVQTLHKMRGRKKDGEKPAVPRDVRYQELVSNTDLVIADEVHHFAGGGEWHKVLQDFDSIFKVGLSATAFLDSESEQERGVIWLKATCGDVQIDIPTSLLIEQGFLMKQNVRMYTMREPKTIATMKWSQTLRERAITGNEARNKKVAEFATLYSKDMKVLIVSNRLEQIGKISQILLDYGTKHETVTGKDKQDAREDKVAGFLSGEYNVLVGTVFGEGVDIPAVEVVVNAEGGADVKNTIQRMRNMTVSEGKKMAILIDFMDLMNPYFEKHSLARLATYQSESAFDVEVL